MEEYLALNRALIDRLREKGVYFSYNSRIALFWLRGALPGLEPDREWLKETIVMMDTLTKMRTEGSEPPHVNGEYV